MIASFAQIEGCQVRFLWHYLLFQQHTLFMRLFQILGIFVVEQAGGGVFVVPTQAF
jgi:hypothetical protein